MDINAGSEAAHALQTGRLDVACAMSSRPPPSIPQMLAAAGNRVAANDFVTARAICRDILLAAPNTPEAHYLFGVIDLPTDPRKAVEHLGRALELRPRFAQAKAQMARALLAIGRAGDAVQAAMSAELDKPADAYTLDTIGVVYTKANRHADAARMFARAASVSDHPGYHYNHGSALQFLGRMEEARAAYRACLRRQPGHVYAWSALVQITRQTSEANEIPALSQLAGETTEPASLHVLGHALAKAHEDLGDFNASMMWLGRAKAHRRALYDPAMDARLFDAAEEMLSGSRTGGLVGPAPIFVVGMPRTGTTLAERILSSHSEVQSAGELDYFPEAVKRATVSQAPRLLDPDAMRQAMKADPAGMAATYLELVKRTLGFSGRFVDKLPLNFFLVPLILRALPDARIVCLRRHPADTVLSNYRQPFAETAQHLDYTYDLADIARYYVRFDRLVRRYAAELPSDRYREVSYEAVVTDLEGETRGLLDFCDLPFEAACLDFHANPSPVATASAEQVRRPIYATSVGRWRKFRPAIDPALAILVAGGCVSADDLN